MNSAKKIINKIGCIGQVKLVVDVLASIYVLIIFILVTDPIRNGFTGIGGFIKYAFFLVSAVVMTALFFVPGYRLITFILNWSKFFWLKYIVRKTSKQLRFIVKYPCNILSNIVTQAFYALLIMQLSPMSGSRASLLIILLVASTIALNGIVSSNRTVLKFFKSSNMRLAAVSVSTILVLIGWAGTVIQIKKIDKTLDYVNEVYLKYDHCAFSKNKLFEECNTKLPIEERIHIYNRKRTSSPRF